MSGLYSGITFSKSTADSASPSGTAGASPAAAAAAASSSTATPEQKEVERQRQAALEDAARYAAQQAELQAKEAAETARKAALGFQPVVRKRPQGGAAAKARPAIIAAGPSATIAAPPSLIQEASRNASASSGSIISAPPLDLHPATSSKATSSGTSGRTLPPPMTIDETDDVNGFRSTQAGKKAKSKSKKKRGGLNKRDEDPALAWTAEYDPSRPTDYNEYKAYSKRARSERRAAMLRERQMEKRKAGMQSDGSDYSDEDEDDDEDDSDTERRRRIAKAENRFFAPPTSYEDASSAFQPATSQEPQQAASTSATIDLTSMQEDDAPSISAAPPAEDGWAAWSATPAKTDDPFARRAALSQQQPSIHAQPPSRPDPVQRQPSPLQGSYAPPPMPSFVPPFSSVSSSTSSIPSPSFAPPATNFPLPPHMMPPQPTSGSQSPQQFPPGSYTPPSGPSNEAAPPAKVPIAIEEAQARARAIAARLASMGKLGGATKASPAEDQNRAASSMSPLSMPPIPNADEPIPGLGPSPPSSSQAQTQPKENVKPEDFAKNLMAKYGWSKGQGLGATSQGMLNPLALADSERKGKNKEQNQSQAKSGPVGIATAKGRIVSDLKTEREQAEREKYGEPTRVVCLTNMVGRNEVDDELVSDVSEEARKLGVLEKCIVHVQPPYVPEDEAVRVFVVFSGLVGAWKAVKAFDGRYFGGRNVKAKFYNEQAFDLGVLHL